MPMAPIEPRRIDRGVLNPATAATRPVTAPAEKIGPIPSACPTAWIVVSLLGPSEPPDSTVTAPSASAIALSSSSIRHDQHSGFWIHYAQAAGGSSAGPGRAA